VDINPVSPGPVDPGFGALERRRADLTRHHENTARYASSYVSYKTTGWGEFLSDEAQYFTTTFTKRPSVAHSLSLDGDALVEGRYPRVTAGVHKWLQNEKGFYTGAWLFFVVETIGMQAQRTFVMPASESERVGVVTVPWTTAIPADPNYEIIHDFTFTGVAMKAIPSYILETMTS
jgi:hypothetical protein